MVGAKLAPTRNLYSRVVEQTQTTNIMSCHITSKPRRIPIVRAAPNPFIFGSANRVINIVVTLALGVAFAKPGNSILASLKWWTSGAAARDFLAHESYSSKIVCLSTR